MYIRMCTHRATGNQWWDEDNSTNSILTLVLRTYMHTHTHMLNMYWTVGDKGMYVRTYVPTYILV